MPLPFDFYVSNIAFFLPLLLAAHGVMFADAFRGTNPSRLIGAIVMSFLAAALVVITILDLSIGDDPVSGGIIKFSAGLLIAHLLFHFIVKEEKG